MATNETVRRFFNLRVSAQNKVARRFFRLKPFFFDGVARNEDYSFVDGRSVLNRFDEEIDEISRIFATGVIQNQRLGTTNQFDASVVFWRLGK